MAEFHFRRAWHEAARPAFEALPPTVTELFEATRVVAKDLRQGPNLDVIWPDDGGDLRKRFEALDDLTLANAAMVVNAYGHWAPGGEGPQDGSHWKFASYADQVLRARLGVPRDTRGHGASLRIIEGQLRICCSSHWGWTWHVVGLATRHNVLAARESIGRVTAPSLSAPRATRDDYETAIMDIAKAIGPTLEGAGVRLDVERFMVPEGTLKAEEDAAREAAEDAKHDVGKVARAIVAIREALDVSDAAYVVQHLLIYTGTSPTFRQRALAQAGEPAANDGPTEDECRRNDVG